MMTENANQPPDTNKLVQLDIYFVVNPNHEEDNNISFKDLPRWTVFYDGKSFRVQEGLALLKNALAKRFKTLDSKRSVRLSVAINMTESDINSEQ